MSRRSLSQISLLLLFPLCLFCTSPGSQACPQEGEGSKSAPQQEEESPPPQIKKLVIPEQAKQRKNPVAASPESINWGKTLYSSQCSMCHGSLGDGKGDVALSLKLKVPDMSKADVQKKQTDGAYFYIIREGHADMPSETRLEDKEVWDLINYMRTFVKK